eukprot:4305061-Pyramimonas_sp.AAC.1
MSRSCRAIAMRLSCGCLAVVMRSERCFLNHATLLPGLISACYSPGSRSSHAIQGLLRGSPSVKLLISFREAR